MIIPGSSTQVFSRTRLSTVRNSFSARLSMSAPSPVITSYSIHYTKLYDMNYQPASASENFQQDFKSLIFKFKFDNIRIISFSS